MRSPRRVVIGLALGMTLPSCVIDDIDLSHRRCPCVEGWVCDEAVDRCVPADAGSALGDGSRADSGSTLGDGSHPDSGAPRIDSGPPPTTCETISGALFCEDFESGALVQWSTIAPSEGGLIATSTGAAHVGAEGLRITAAGGSGASRLSAAIDSGTASELHFRAWVFVTGAAVGPIELFTLEVPGRGKISAQMLPAYGSFVVEVARFGDAVVSDSGRYGRWAVGEWTCVEGRVVRGEDTGTVEVLDATPHAARLEELDTEWGAPYRVFSVGVQAGTTGEVRFDDVMWTTTRMPCP